MMKTHFIFLLLNQVKQVIRLNLWKKLNRFQTCRHFVLQTMKTQQFGKCVITKLLAMRALNKVLRRQNRLHRKCFA